MPISLEKGSRISLSKAAADAGLSGLKNIIVGLGWDTNRYDGSEAFDLDASAFLLDSDNKAHGIEDFVFYNNLSSKGVTHTGDNRTGLGDGDDEQILIELDGIPPEIAKIAFAVTIDQADARRQNFGAVENAFIHVMDKDTGTDLLKYDLTEDYSIETALVVAELYRNNGEWKFNAVGAGFANGLAALCANYGLDAG